MPGWGTCCPRARVSEQGQVKLEKHLDSSKTGWWLTRDLHGTHRSPGQAGKLPSSSSPPGCVSLGMGQHPSGPLDLRLQGLIQESRS